MPAVGRYHSPVQAPVRVVILVANPITYDGRVRRHATTLVEAGYDVCVIGVVGPNDRADPPTLRSDDGSRSADAMGAGAVPAQAGWRWRRIDRRRTGLGPRLRWLTSASRQRLAQASFALLQPAAGDSAGFTGAWLAQLSGLSVATSAPDLAWAALQERPQLIYANDLDTLPAACWAAQLAGVGFVYDAHEVYVDEHPDLGQTTRRVRAYAEAYFSRRAKAVLTVNELIARDLQGRYDLPNPTVVRNLPQLDDNDAAHIPSPDQRPLGEPGTLHLLYQGAHIGLSQHGVDDMLRAVARLRQPGPGQLQLRLTLRGGLSVDEDRRLRLRCQALGIVPQVDLVAPVPGAEALVHAALRDGADVGLAVHPPLCLSYVYTTSSKVYEYQLAGLAVVASDVTGNRHSVGPDAGVFYPAGDDARLADVLRELSWDRRKLRRLQQAAYLHGKRNLRWQDERLRLLDVIRQSLA